MLRVTDEIVELRHVAEARGIWPHRHVNGSLALLPGEAISFFPVSWGEFEATFRIGRQVLVYDDAPGACSAFVGTAQEVRDYVARADPRVSGSAGPSP